MFLAQLELTTALRPAYLSDEVLLFVQDHVGLYEGKFKLPDQQDGQVYLTSHRVCYVDSNEPRKASVSLNLKDIERHEFYAGFLKSSAKVTLYPKPSRGSTQRWQSSIAGAPPRSGTPLQPSDTGSVRRGNVGEAPRVNNATWVCTVCAFSNPVASNFDASTANTHTVLPPCLLCGVKPDLTQILKAAIASATTRPSVRPSATASFGPSVTSTPPREAGSNLPRPTDADASFQCPRCTYSNHPSLLTCEICGASLVSHELSVGLEHMPNRPPSPGPTLSSNAIPGQDHADSIKISFRVGGDKIFYTRLKGALTQRKWLLEGAPPIPGSIHSRNGSLPGSNGNTSLERKKVVGIAGLEQRSKDTRKNNELVIGSAFEDLEALMAFAKEIVTLAETFAKQTGGAAAAAGGGSADNALLAESASQLGLVTTRDIVGSDAKGSLYHSELARNLAEFLTDDARGTLRRAGGIMSLVDLWAVFNRARGGVELVSPADFEKAARLWETLKLPVRLRTFKSGTMVVQSREYTDETTIKAISSWLKKFHEIPPEREVAWDWREFGRGVTARDVAERFGWSIGVAEEELEMAEERGVLCREEGIEGLRFWENHIGTTDDSQLRKTDAQEAHDQIVKALETTGLI